MRCSTGLYIEELCLTGLVRFAVQMSVLKLSLVNSSSSLEIAKAMSPVYLKLFVRFGTTFLAKTT